MEKRENESWEDYSFRNGIYKIIYENDKIIDVNCKLRFLLSIR